MWIHNFEDCCSVSLVLGRFLYFLQFWPLCGSIFLLLPGTFDNRRKRFYLYVRAYSQQPVTRQGTRSCWLICLLLNLRNKVGSRCDYVDKVSALWMKMHKQCWHCCRLYDDKVLTCRHSLHDNCYSDTVIKFVTASHKSGQKVQVLGSSCMHTQYSNNFNIWKQFGHLRLHFVSSNWLSNIQKNVSAIKDIFTKTNNFENCFILYCTLFWPTKKQFKIFLTLRQ